MLSLLPLFSTPFVGFERCFQIRLAPNEGVRKITTIYISATNSSTDIPAARINARSVPGANSRCCGTDKLAACPGLMRMTWLPRWRSLFHPAFWKTRTARSPEREAKLPSMQEPRLLGLLWSEACHERRVFRDTRRWPHECFPGPRLRCVPGRCSREWKGTRQRACRSRRVPASQAASYLDFTPRCFRRWDPAICSTLNS